MGFFDVAFAELSKSWPTFLSGYAKRFLEYGYDRAFANTALGRKLVGFSSFKKHAVELGLNLLNAFFIGRLAENTSLMRFVKEVGLDAAPEVSKRMFNGIREEIQSSAKTSVEKDLAQVFLGLEDKELVLLLRWLDEKPTGELTRISNRLSLMSAEQTARLMNFSAEDRERFFGVIDPRTRPKESKRGVLGMIADDINKLNERLEKKEMGQ